METSLLLVNDVADDRLISEAVSCSRELTEGVVGEADRGVRGEAIAELAADSQES